MAIEIRCRNPLTNKVTTITRDMRTGFRFSKHTNIGDRDASWTIDCAHIQKMGINPELNSRVKVVDTDRSDKVLWTGLLRKPVGKWERGALTAIDFSAAGYGKAGLNTFQVSTKFGDASHAATSKNRVLITDLGNAMQHGLTRAPLITGTQSHIDTSTGITLNADTEEFRGRRPDDLWTSITAITARLATPFIWLVQADESGEPALYWYARPSTPEFLEGGRSKTMSLGVDADQIANLIVVAFHGDDIRTAPDQVLPMPIDYSQIADIQDVFVDVGEQLYFLDDALGYAGGMLNRWNRREINNGEVVLDEDLKARYIGAGADWNTIPITDVSPGHVIRVQVQGFKPYLASGRADVFIEETTYNEDDCSLTASFEAIGQGARDARLITTIPGAGMKWQIMYGPQFNPSINLWTMVKPERNTGAGPNLFSTMNGNGAPGEGIGPGTSFSKPPAQGTPPAATDPAPDLTAPPMLSAGSIPGAVPDEDHPNEFGRFGWMQHPETQPPERTNFNFVLQSDAEGTDIVDKIFPGQDVQEVWVDFLSLKLPGPGPVGSITVHLHLYRHASGATITDVFDPISLVAENATSLALARDDRVLLLHGDHLYCETEGASGVDSVSVGVAGWKHYWMFPDYDGPSWVPLDLA